MTHGCLALPEGRLRVSVELISRGPVFETPEISATNRLSGVGAQLDERDQAALVLLDGSLGCSSTARTPVLFLHHPPMTRYVGSRCYCGPSTFVARVFPPLSQFPRREVYLIAKNAVCLSSTDRGSAKELWSGRIPFVKKNKNKNETAVKSNLTYSSLGCVYKMGRHTRDGRKRIGQTRATKEG